MPVGAMYLVNGHDGPLLFKEDWDVCQLLAAVVCSRACPRAMDAGSAAVATGETIDLAGLGPEFLRRVGLGEELLSPSLTNA